MKKSLLLLSAVAIASLANAQVVVGLATSEDLEAAGLGSTKVDHEPCTILENEAGTFGLAYQDSWGTTTTYKTYQSVKVNGEAIKLGSGAVGNTNPSFTSYNNVMSAGAVFKIECKKDGYMTVFTKLNPNKQYVVYENSKDGAIIFTLGWTNGTQEIHYTVPNDGEGYIDFNAADASKYFVQATEQIKNDAGVNGWVSKTDKNDIVYAKSNPDKDKYEAYNKVLEGQNKPQMPWIVAGFESAPGESTGFVTFPVFEGADYYFSALGSKAACGGFVYTENDPQIVFDATSTTDKDTGAVTEYKEVVFNPLMDPSAVETLGAAAVENADAPVYNMMGVRVNADAKGILIQNGKKFIRK